MEYKEIVWYGLSCVYTSQHWGDCWYSGVLHLCCRSYWVVRDRLRNWFWVVVWLLRPGYCSLTWYNPGMLTGLLTGHNTLRRDLYIMGLIKSPLCWRCWAEEETPAHILCVRESSVTLRTPIWGVPLFFLGGGTPIVLEVLSLGAIRNFLEERGSLDLDIDYRAQRVCLKGLCASERKELEPIYYSVLF